MRIIPSIYDPGTPPGEKRLFELFKLRHANENWIVLHSLAIADHVTQMEGESDFVLLIPGKAILIIEVKSHLSVSVTSDGLWKLGQDEPRRRSPFTQARGQAHSIRQYLRKTMPIAAGAIPIISTVWFTEFEAKSSIPRSIEWNDWELLDSTDLVDSKAAIIRTIDSSLKHSNFRKNSSNFVLPLDIFDDVAEVLKPRFDITISSNKLSKIRRTQVNELTREQFKYLNGWKRNRVGIIEGTAGTGKTFLAIETAARAILEEKSILFLCRSELLCKYLRGMLKYNSDSYIGTFSAFQNDVDSNTKFDTLIIDEAQDLLTHDTLLRISENLRGGIEGAHIRIFADYEGQRIYDVPDGRPALKLLCPDVFTFELSENCRNLPSIGSAALFLSGRDGLDVSYRRADDSSTPELFEYSNFDESVKQLLNSYNHLLTLRFMPEEIVILCEENSESITRMLRALDVAQIKVSKFDPTLDYQRLTTWSTISDFKGFDACCTIVYGLESENSNEIDPFVYVSLTRARDRLVVISKPRFFSKRVKEVTSNA